ncbi:PQQ-binding-like beta-propeller repeat protein [Kitasatospora sp. NPDC001540]|uniref:outer membrane protein assembly factor BamB family protein n=1 Tax=Kitasatospora sp. NPDC001540 TaxID=3364014 RepID=UPI0036944FFC
MDQLTAHDPRRIGPFEVLARLGAGGMGLVYLARSASGRRVAIKTVRSELAEDNLFRVRFAREIAAAKTVGGFYTAAVVDADADAAVPWLATAYVPAPSLEDLVNDCGPLPADAVRWLTAGIAEALQSIHAAGLVHRDLKPSNVLVVEDGPRVIDFGIAAGVSSTRLTMTNVAVGTPAYMSPEQARDSRSVTGASDVFSLGSLVVFCATGHPPYRGSNPVETVFQLLRDQPDLSGLPAELVDLVRACMRPTPEHRPTPAQIQAELAPHLFSRADASGEAGDWLPPAALDLIEAKRSSRRPVTAQQQPPARPQQQVALPAQPVGPPPGPPALAPAPAGPVSESEVATERVRPSLRPAVGGPGEAEIRLPGAHVPIGPGPRAEPAAPASAPAGTDWVRRSSAPSAAPPLPPARWRPWRFRMSNDVWGTPVVADGTLFASSFEVHALDIGSGERRWKTRDVAWALAVDGGRVHAADGPHLYTVDAADGTERWRHSLDGWVYSLDAADGVLCCGVRGGGVQLRAAATGAELWRADDAQQEYENPQSGPALIAGAAYYQGGGRLHCVDPLGAGVRWTVPLGGEVPSRPVERGGVLYVTSGQRVHALDAATGAERWRFDAPVVLFTPPAVDARAVYVADYLGTLYALDAATGHGRWRAATAARQSAEPAVVADGTVLLGSGDTLFAFEAADGRERWRYPTRGDLVGSPAVSEGLVHLGSRDHSLHTLELASGRLRWELGTKGELTGSPVAVGGRVFVGSKDRCVYALDSFYGTAVPQ